MLSRADLGFSSGGWGGRFEFFRSALPPRSLYILGAKGALRKVSGSITKKSYFKAVQKEHKKRRPIPSKTPLHINNPLVNNMEPNPIFFLRDKYVRKSKSKI